jgi:hypothetical protein
LPAAQGKAIDQTANQGFGFCGAEFFGDIGADGFREIIVGFAFPHQTWLFEVVKAAVAHRGKEISA